MQNIYHATAYDPSASGFYFRSFEEYQAKSVCHKNDYGQAVDEFELQAIKVENYALFEALNINQATLKSWFEDFEDLAGNELVAAIYLVEYIGCDTADILDRIDEVSLFEGSALEYAHSHIEDCGLLDDMPENLRFYFDVDAFARDMLLSGDITEVEINNTTYVIWGC